MEALILAGFILSGIFTLKHFAELHQERQDSE